MGGCIIRSFPPANFFAAAQLPVDVQARLLVAVRVSKDTQELAQILGQLQPSYGRIPTGTHGPTRIVWANLTPFSLQ